MIYAIACGTWVAGIYCKNLFIKIISLQFLVHDFVKIKDHFMVDKLVQLLNSWKVPNVVLILKSKSLLKIIWISIQASLEIKLFMVETKHDKERKRKTAWLQH